MHLRPLGGLLLASILLATPAWSEPSDADRATARALAQEGQDALEARQFSDAAERFSRANSLVNAPTLLLGLARAQAGLGKVVESQETYNRILRDGVPKPASPLFLKALEDAKKELAVLEPRIAWITISIAGATDPKVTIDGAIVPAAALGVKRAVNPGAHLITATADGRAEAESRVTLAEGETAASALELGAPLPAPAPLAPSTTPSAAAPEIAKPPASRRTAAMIAFGVGGAGLAVGAVAGLLASSKHGSLSEACPTGTCAASERANVDSYQQMGAVSTIGFIVGVAGAGAGLTLLLTAPREPKAGGLRISPHVGLMGLGATGQFD